MYFRRLQDFFLAADVTDNDSKISLFKMGLSSADYARFCIEVELPDEYEEVEDKLRHLFEPHVSEQALCEAFLGARQVSGESVAQFAARVKSAATKAYPTLSPDARGPLIL